MEEILPLRGCILINGFWRSGTTWVQQVLAESYGAKTIFEPLAPSSQFPLQKRIFDESSPTSWLESFLPLSYELLLPEDLDYLDSAFAGCSRTRSTFPYLCRQSLLECFRRRLVIKFVRAHCLLGYMIERYGAIPVQISRHPCAVVASFHATDWTWNFSDVNFSRMYQTKRTFKNPKAEEDREILVKYSQASPLAKVMALWAVMERRAAATPGVVHVRYEDLVRAPQREFNNLARKIGVILKHPLSLETDSPVTVESRNRIGSAHRLHSWKWTLPLEKQTSVRHIVEAIWPAGASLWFDTSADSP